MATGKISRLPREIREQLNRRLDEGEPGKRLVGWLNELPAVQALLAEDFGGAAINEQNLTNWKQGGFRDWRRELEVAALSPKLAGEKPATTEQLLTLATTRYLVLARDCHRKENPNRQWRRWRMMCQDVLELQRSEHQAGRLKLGWERLQFTRERFAAEKLTGDRRAMVSFLMAARQWPEVQEALAGAFRLFQERKAAELGAIKVDQGGMDKKNGEMQNEMGCCGDEPSPPRRMPVDGGDDQACPRVQESDAQISRRPAETPLQEPGVPRVNRGKSDQIKVDQGVGEINNEGAQIFPDAGAWMKGRNVPAFSKSTGNATRCGWSHKSGAQPPSVKTRPCRFQLPSSLPSICPRSSLTASDMGFSLNQMANAKKPKRKAMMLGLGLDSDGHKRITKGDNFTLVGGTKDTHEQMTEKAIKINEKLKARGKQLETVSREEFSDIAHEVGLKSLPKPNAN